MKLELCVGSIEAIPFANQYHFDRIELCQALEVGGLTPSPALYEFARTNTKKEIHVLIRPRIGNFLYSSSEKELILNEIQFFCDKNCSGIVIGALNEKAQLDLPFLRQIRQQFPSLALTFHRAFDDVTNKKEALQQLIDLGFKRILTAGSKANIEENIAELKELVQDANKQIDIMIGGGIKVQNCKKLVTEINPHAIHFSGTVFLNPLGNNRFDEILLVANQKKIEEILMQLS